ncbi:MAG: hypothetical protein MUF85_03475 [Patescibacteria group bacterium]|jgi:hypothetical protein|nr:hypothetical protein [Patescibacteria group bacterium]
MFIVPSFNPDLLDTEPVSNRERAKLFFSNLRINEKETSICFAEDLYKPDKPLPDILALVPIAAHQESPEAVKRALELYTKQRTTRPIGVVALLNSPIGGLDTINAQRVISVCNEARDGQDLDFRFTSMEIEEPTIGFIRRCLWNSTLYLAIHDGLFDGPDNGDVVALNHDIDSVGMGANYFRNVQSFYDRKRKLYKGLGIGSDGMLPASTMVRHNLPNNKKHPNLRKAIFWYDYIYHLARHSIGFEAGLAIPFSHYIRTSGFQPDSKTHETRDITKDNPIWHIPRTFLESSPRRLMERLQEHSLSNIWTTDSFFATDPCREDKDWPDITYEQLADIILETLQPYMENIVVDMVLKREIDKNISTHYTKDDFGELEVAATATVIVSQRFRKIVRVLRNVIGSAELADLVENCFDPEQIAGSILKNSDYLGTYALQGFLGDDR